MSHRVKHRDQALLRRAERVVKGLPADPSRRDRNARTRMICRSCRSAFRKPWQTQLHRFMGCAR